MAIALENYRDILDELGSHANEVLHASWQVAAREFSPKALEVSYLHGARTLKALGRGSDLVVTFLQEAPEVAREIGEEAVADLLDCVVRCASKTSASVIALMIGSSPVAAQRLAERELFRAYLRLIENLLAQAPRGVRPMLEHLGPLLGQLTLGGLRRWAMWGAQAHRTDFEAQLRYFALESPDALAVLQQERKGTLFVDVQRRIAMYLRALWGRDFYMRPTSGDFEAREGYQPYIESYLIHLPDAYDDIDGLPGLELYRAAAAHAAAHLAYTRAALSAEALNPLQMAVIGTIEDARVETLAIKAFPGLRTLWRGLHKAAPDQQASCGDFLNRLARALLDPDYRDDATFVAHGRALFARAQERLADNQIAWDIGVELAHELPRIAPAYHPRTDLIAAPYRDDNRYVWAFDELEFGAPQAAPWLAKQVRRNVGLMEFINEIDVETAGDDAQEVWVLSSELFPYEDLGISYNQTEGKEPAPEPYHYPEWDYQIQLERPSWVTVLEQRATCGDTDTVDSVVTRYKPIVRRLKHLIEALQPQGVQRVRRLEDGDEIDLNAAISSLTQIRMGDQPDPRIMMRNVRKTRDVAVLLLLDLSQSTGDKVRGSEQTVLELARDASALLADAMDRIGDPFAIHGFASDGRHEVRYFRFKDFETAYDEGAKGRLAGMASGLSTRMGAAIRHAGRFLRQRPQSKRLLLVLTDGEPADVDVRDPQYLRHDTKKAVDDLAREGITTYCLSLDAHADQYVSRIFGARNYRVLDHLERLPEQLPALYMGLSR